MMFSLLMLTQSSLSGLVCSCQKPTTCPSSCTTIPNLSQFLPMEMACGPLPRLPTKEQQPHGRSVNTIQFGCSSALSTNCTQVKFSQWRMA